MSAKRGRANGEKETEPGLSRRSLGEVESVKACIPQKLGSGLVTTRTRPHFNTFHFLLFSRLAQP